MVAEAPMRVPHRLTPVVVWYPERQPRPSRNLTPRTFIGSPPHHDSSRHPLDREIARLTSINSARVDIISTTILTRINYFLHHWLHHEVDPSDKISGTITNPSRVTGTSVR
jgi:hypothetical protein